MRTTATPWNRSYKQDLVKELKSKRRGFARSKAQQAAKTQAQKHFQIHETPKTPQELPDEWKAIGSSRKRVMERVEDKEFRDSLKEVWE